MSREKIKCPGCDCKVLVSEIEKNDGQCPECGQQVFGFESNLFDDYQDEDDDLELEEQENNDFEDDDDLEDYDEDEFERDFEEELEDEDDDDDL